MAFNSSSYDLRRMDIWQQKHAEWMKWSLGVKCPCSTMTDVSRANPNCAVCFGTGWFYTNEQEIRGIVTDARFDKQLKDTGMLQAGDLSLGPEIRGNHPILQNYDRIILAFWGDGLPYDGDVIVRTPYATDRTIYAPIQVQMCASVDPVVGTITSYTLGTDFTLNGRELSWLTGRGPSVGQTYSLKYTTHYEWIVLVPASPRYERGTSLGQRVVLRARHIVFNQSS